MAPARKSAPARRPGQASARTSKASRPTPAAASNAPKPDTDLVEFAAIPPPVRFERPPPPARGNAIETTGLSKTYGERAAVDGLSITVPRGQVVGFVGPNGAGKTTTIRMLLGLIRPSGGTASVLGQSVDDPTSYLPKVGALIESPAFYANLSGAANLKVLCRLGGFDAARIPRLLEQVGLAERGDEPYKRYSLGMKQRLGIAAALLPDPELLILDEPTNGLDPAGIHEIRDFLRGLGDQGKTVFVSSHLLAEIEKMCDHVVMLRRGRLVFQGTMAELVARGAGLTVRPEHARDGDRLAALCRKAGYQVEQREGHLVVLGATPDRAAAINRAAMAAGITLSEISGGSGDLEQTFLAMTGEGEL